MSRFPKFVVLGLSFLVFSYVGLGYVLGQTGADDERTYRSLTVYSEVLQRIQELKSLLKFLGKDKEALIMRLDSLLEGIRKRQDEFHRSP